MEHVIVTVKRANEARVRDIMLPANMPVGELAAVLTEKLAWDRDANNRLLSYDIVADPPGRLLDPEETLAQAGAWDGSWLVFHPQGTVPRPGRNELAESTAQPERKSSPVLRWLGINKAPSTPSEPPRQPDKDVTQTGSQENELVPPTSVPTPKYVFKRIDDDT